MVALHALNGVKFDPQSGSVLHIEMARSNSRRKRESGSGAYVVIDRRSKSTTDAQETSSDDGNSDADEPGANNPESGNKDDLVNTATTKSGEAAVDPDNAVAAVNEHVEKTVEGGVPPCSTLFIANLGPNCTEDELKQVISPYPGFKILKLRARVGMPVAFADFEEIEQATKVLEDLQGSILASSDRGGMHIEYARSKMRKS